MEELEALRKQHKTKHRDAEVHESAVHAVDRFFRTTIRSVIRENGSIFEPSDKRRRESGTHSSYRSDYSGSSRARRQRIKTQSRDASSTSGDRVKDASSRAQLPSERVSGTRGPQQPLVQTDLPEDGTSCQEAPRASTSDLSSRQPDSEHQMIEGDIIVLKTTNSESLAEIERQEHCRKIEKQSQEHTDNVFRDKAAAMRMGQQEAEDRLSGRPQGRQDARKSQARRHRLEKHSEQKSEQSLDSSSSRSSPGSL